MTSLHEDAFGITVALGGEFNRKKLWGAFGGSGLYQAKQFPVMWCGMAFMWRYCNGTGTFFSMEDIYIM